MPRCDGRETDGFVVITIVLCNSKLINCINNQTCIILYADDILLIAPTITSLENLLHACKTELKWLDMSINAKKSNCIRIGPRIDAMCRT